MNLLTNRCCAIILMLSFGVYLKKLSFLLWFLYKCLIES